MALTGAAIRWFPLLLYVYISQHYCCTTITVIWEVGGVTSIETCVDGVQKPNVYSWSAEVVKVE